MQQVEEGVAVGIRTRLQQGQHGDQPWVLILDVYMKISQHAVNRVGSVRLTGHRLKVLFISLTLMGNRVIVHFCQRNFRVYRQTPLYIMYM